MTSAIPYFLVAVPIGTLVVLLVTLFASRVLIGTPLAALVYFGLAELPPPPAVTGEHARVRARARERQYA